MLRLLLKYVEQLEEQNDLLIETLEELELEAAERVKQMERRLKSTARTTMETVINFHEWEQEMERLVKERIEMEAEFLKMQHQASSVIVENNFLRDQSFNLNHDIQALLHIIHHARSTGHWEMDCVTFCEVTPEQVFGPMQSLETYYPQKQKSPSPPLLAITDNSPKKCKTYSDERLSDSDSSSLRSFDISPPVFHKESMCTCSVIKYRKDNNGKCLPQRNEVAMNTVHHSSVPVQTNLPRSFSVPAFRRSNMCSHYKQNLCNYKSCSIIGNETSVSSSDVADSYTLKTLFSDTPDDTKSCKSLSRSSRTSVFHRAYSEPHLFMFGDCIYVYRPCEALHRVSSYTSKDNTGSFQPCRSIDLKLPSDSLDCERAWGLHHSATDFCLSRSSSMPFGADQLSKDFSSLTRSKDFQNSGTRVDSRSSSQYKVFPSFNFDKKCQTDKYASPVRKFNARYSSPKKSVISCGIQTMDVKSFTIGLQADFSDQNTDGVTKVLSESTVEGMTVADVNKTIQTLKTNLRKAEDQVSAQTILIQELQRHLNAVYKNVEMKDAVLEIVEKKLNESRTEVKTLKEELSSVNSRLTDLQNDLEVSKKTHFDLQDELKQHQGKFDELKGQEKILLEQKRSLMTQLDARGDEFEKKLNELLLAHHQLEKYSLQIEQQSQIILSLQEALVQSKRAFDELQKTHNNYSLTRNEAHRRSLHSSRNAVLEL